MKTLLPGLFETLSMYADILPAGKGSPVYPFSSFVININVSTLAHRDWGDEDVCLVISFLASSGGELCLYEPGVVLGLEPGDVVIFKSSLITHFNLPYVGKRVSMVMHSDRHAKSWVKDFNGWDGNIYLSTSRNVPGDIIET